MHDLTGQQLLFRPGIMDKTGYPLFKSSCSMTPDSALGCPGVYNTIFDGLVKNTTPALRFIS